MLVIAVAGVVQTAPASAIDNGLWAVEPGGAEGPGGRDHFVYTMSPGQSLRDTLSITNFTTEPVSLALYPTDAYNTPVDAAFAMLEADDAPVEVGTWIDSRFPTYEVPAQTRVDIPFEITVPLDATPGDHAGAIVAEATDPEAVTPEGSPVGVEVRQRLGARVYVRVQGPAEPGLQVANITVTKDEELAPYVTGRGGTTVTYEVRNTGNLRLSGEAVASLRGPFGWTLHTFAARDLPELLPGSSTIVTETWDQLPPLFKLDARVEVTATDIDVVRSRGFWSIPWLYLTIVAAAVGMWRWWRNRRRRVDEPDESDGPTTAEPIDVTDQVDLTVHEELAET